MDSCLYPHAWKIVKATDELLHSVSFEFQEREAHGNETPVMSTGVIGQHVPIESILSSFLSQTPFVGSLLVFHCFGECSENVHDDGCIPQTPREDDRTGVKNIARDCCLGHSVIRMVGKQLVDVRVELQLFSIEDGRSVTDPTVRIRRSWDAKSDDYP